MNLRVLSAAVPFLLLAGCTTVNDLYPRFKAQSAAMRTVVITSDVMVLEDVKGPLPLVDIPRDLALAQDLNEFLREGFEKRGLRVAATEVSSLGLRQGSAVTPPIKVRTAGQAAGVPLDALGTARAPFFVAPAYTEPAQRGGLQDVFEDIRRYQAAPGVPNVTSRTLRQLPSPEGVTHRVFILVEGVQVPMGKGMGHAVLTGLLTLGTVSAFAMTTVNFRIGIADVATGEFILIEDCTLAGGWTVDAAYLRRQAGIFLAHFDRLRK